MLRRLVKLGVSLAVAFGDQRRWPRARGRGAPGSRGVVLYYHAVRPEHRQAFARQMDWIAAHAKPWPLDGPVPEAPLWVGISFDDAYVSVWEHALPELEKRSLPCTIFVPSGCLGRRPSWVHSPDHPYWQEQVMSVEQIRALAQMPGVTIGSHTVSHPHLPRIPRPEAERELKDSKRVLEDLTGKPVELLSFPHGAWTPELVDLALQVGYRRLFGIQPSCVEDGAMPSLLGRTSVEPTDWTLEFRLKARGCYRWLTRPQRRP